MTTEKRTVAPDMNWLAEGKEDPHPTYVDQTREDLTLADYSDDELANAVFMSGDISREEDTTRMIAAHRAGVRYIAKISLLTAAKERIRWLTRRLAVAEGRYPGISKPAVEDDVMVEALKSAAHKMLETDPSRSLSSFETIAQAENTVMGQRSCYFDEVDGSYYVEGYLNVKELEALLFAGRVREMAKPLGLSVDIKEVDVDQLRQVAFPNTQVTDIDSSIFSSPEMETGEVTTPDPMPKLSMINEHGHIVPTQEWADWYESTFGTDTGSGYIKASAMIGQIMNSHHDSLHAQMKNWAPPAMGQGQQPTNPEVYAASGMMLGSTRDKTIIVSGHTARELSHLNGFEPLEFPGAKPIPRKNRFLPLLGDHEGDSMLPKRLLNRAASTPRQNAFASTALGKLLARALPNRSKGETETSLKPEHIARAEEILRKEEVLGFGPIDYYPIKLNDNHPVRHNPNHLAGESEMTTENDRYEAGSMNLNKAFGKLGDSGAVLAKGTAQLSVPKIVDTLKGDEMHLDQSKFTETQELGGRGKAVLVQEEAPAPKLINFGKEGDYPELNPEWTQWFMQLHSLSELAAKGAAVNVFSNTLTMVRGRFNENKDFSANEKQLLEGLGFVNEGRHAFIIETLEDVIQDIQINSGL